MIIIANTSAAGGIIYGLKGRHNLAQGKVSKANDALGYDK